MKKKEAPRTPEGGASDLFAKAQALQGKTGGVDPTELDPLLLWGVVVILAKRSASIQLGVTRDGSAWAVQFWDGKYPIKDYHNTTASLNRSLAALIRAEYGGGLDGEMEKRVSAHGW